MTWLYAALGLQYRIGVCTINGGDLSAEDGEMNETYWPEEGSNLRSPTFQAGRFNHCTRAQAIAFERRVSLTDGSFDSVVA